MFVQTNLFSFKWVKIQVIVYVLSYLLGSELIILSLKDKSKLKRAKY